MKAKQYRWKKNQPQVKGARYTYRKGPGTVAIHDYGTASHPFLLDYLGINERFRTLKEAKAYGNGFVAQ